MSSLAYPASPTDPTDPTGVLASPGAPGNILGGAPQPGSLIPTPQPGAPGNIAGFPTPRPGQDGNILSYPPIPQPLSASAAPNPQTQSGIGGAAPVVPPPAGQGWINAPSTDDPNYYLPPVQQIGVAPGFGLPGQIGIPSNGALGGFTDSEYLSSDAALRAQVGQQYAQILQQLGYQDPNSGNVIPGTAAQDANIQLAQQQQAAQQALMQVVQNAQNNGTIFSGIRGTQTAQALAPFQQNMAQIGLNSQRTMQDLYNQAQNLVTNYNTQNQQNLSAAAARNLAQIQQNQLLAAIQASANQAINQGGGGGAPTTDASSSTGTTSDQGFGVVPAGSAGAVQDAANAAANVDWANAPSLASLTPWSFGPPAPQSQGFGSVPAGAFQAIQQAAHQQLQSGYSPGGGINT